MMERAAREEPLRRSKGTQMIGIEELEKGVAEKSEPSPLLTPLEQAQSPSSVWAETGKASLLEASPGSTMPTPPLAKISFLRWAQGKNPFRPKPAVKKRPAPVQGELLLESVKVVRNDLNEADLELVPLRSPEPAPQRNPSSAKAKNARPAWRRMATRLFGNRNP